MIGFTRDEGFSVLSSHDTCRLPRGAALWRSFVELLGLYPASDDSRRGEPPWTSPATRRSAPDAPGPAPKRNGKAPAYVYMFSRVHPYAPGVKFSDHDRTVGVYHTADVPYWLGRSTA